jgi:hypothetical protein
MHGHMREIRNQLTRTNKEQETWPNYTSTSH